MLYQFPDVSGSHMSKGPVGVLMGGKQGELDPAERWRATSSFLINGEAFATRELRG